ncbi:hypothetical protein SAMN05421829_10641 [Aromatoleum tolulyticum]|uniref:Uncharacterized protein n=1 Tax=Aromatoleum tolulyticum TaxID=34027 RepID=A0A1N6UTT0_9RHOO|nr:hypothetical protein SAMN05421829_10641 [Aromatoleum tolulyticum]
MLRMIRAIVNAVNPATARNKFAANPIHQSSEIILGVVPSTDTSLIRNDNHHIAGAICLCYELKYSVNKLKVFLTVHIAVINIDHTVTIQKESAPKHTIYDAANSDCAR